MDKDLIVAFLILFIIGGATYGLIKHYRNIQWEDFLEEKNQWCKSLEQTYEEQSNLSVVGADCDCYYADCLTESQEANKMTDPGCVCDCWANESLFSVCVRIGA